MPLKKIWNLYSILLLESNNLIKNSRKTVFASPISIIWLSSKINQIFRIWIFYDNIEQKHYDYCFNMYFLGSVWILFSVLGDQGIIMNKTLTLRLVEWTVSAIRHGHISGQASPTTTADLIKAILKSWLILFNYYRIWINSENCKTICLILSALIYCIWSTLYF